MFAAWPPWHTRKQVRQFARKSPETSPAIGTDRDNVVTRRSHRGLSTRVFTRLGATMFSTAELLFGKPYRLTEPSLHV
jgi:hypothetical protein